MEFSSPKMEKAGRGEQERWCKPTERLGGIASRSLTKASSLIAKGTHHQQISAYLARSDNEAVLVLVF